MKYTNLSKKGGAVNEYEKAATSVERHLYNLAGC